MPRPHFPSGAMDSFSGYSFDPAQFQQQPPEGGRDHFSAQEFLSRHRLHVDLQTLQTDLFNYLDQLKLELVELINKDYEQFLALSSTLVGIDAEIEEVLPVLRQLKDKVVGVEDFVKSSLDATEITLERQKSVKTEKENLQLCLRVINNIAILEALIGIDHDEATTSEQAEPAQRDTKWKQSDGGDVHREADTGVEMEECLEDTDSLNHEDRRTQGSRAESVVADGASGDNANDVWSDYCNFEFAHGASAAGSLFHGARTASSTALRLERAAKLIPELATELIKGAEMTFVQSLAPRVSKIEQQLAEKLEVAFATEVVPDVLYQRRHTVDAGVVRSCLRAYVFLDKAEVAENLVASSVLRPYLEEICTRTRLDGGRRGSCEGLSDLYGAILDFVRTRCGELIRVAHSRTREEGSCGVDIVDRGIWREIVTGLCQRLPQIFSPGNPENFHRNYVRTQKFIEDFQRLIEQEQANSRLSHTNCLSKEMVNLLANLQLQLPQARILDTNSNVYNVVSLKNTYTASLMNRWDLGVYFKLRQSDSRRLLAKVLSGSSSLRRRRSDPSVSSSSSSSSATSASLPLLIPTSTALEEASKVLSTSVFLAPLTDRFVGLSVDIVSRFVKWAETLLKTAATQRFSAADPSQGTYKDEDNDNNRDADKGSDVIDLEERSTSSGESKDKQSFERTAQTNRGGQGEARIAGMDILVLCIDLDYLHGNVNVCLRREILKRVEELLQGSKVGERGKASEKTGASDVDDRKETANVASTMVERLLQQTLAKAHELQKDGWKIVGSEVAERCEEALPAIKHIATSYRWTNKPAPTTHSTFLNAFVEPLTMVLDQWRSFLTRENKNMLIEYVLTQVCIRYAEMAEELIVAAKQMEDSLRKRKQKRGTLQQRSDASKPGGTGTTGTEERRAPTTDADKILLQLYLDVVEFRRILQEIGYDTENSVAFQSLYAKVKEGELFT